MDLSKPLRTKLRDLTISIQRLALRCFPATFVLHHLARHGRTGHIRLKAAHRLNSHALLVQLAHEASEDSIRLKAALDTGAQSALTAIALKAWDIDLGTRAVARLTSSWSLMRVARSARQDAIRLHAASKLHSPRLLRHLAETTSDIHVRFKIAQALDDPYLLAQISQFKRTNAHLAPLRFRARQALLDHLDALVDKNQQTTLKAIFLGQSDLSIRLEVFVRFGPEIIDQNVLGVLSMCNFEHAPTDLIRQALTKIIAAGWDMVSDEKQIQCRHCGGKGTLCYRSISALQHQLESDMLPCVECNSQGRIRQLIITCTRDGARPIALTLPKGTLYRTHMVPR